MAVSAQQAPQRAPQGAPQGEGPDDGGPVRELRLALVCYGGVSLAIYMHGTTKEIHKLVVASEGRRRSPEENPFPEQTTEHVYWEALGELERAEGIPTRVVVDIISGTSAGGINGVFLAKALAHNLDQQALRELWLVQGDIHRLTKPTWLPVAGRFGLWLLRGIPRFGGKPPLDGDFLLRQAHDALTRMNAERVAVAGSTPDTLMLPRHDLRLFVTTTDFRGYPRRAPAYAPIQVPSEWHRHVYAFERTATHDAFGPAYDPALAFAARTTSSFPGAFPPARLDDVRRVLRAELPAGFDEEFFPAYALADVRCEDAWLIDGGVLDNFPFRAATQAIFAMPASSEVDRRLLYIEPDPASAATTAPGPPAPGFLPTVFGALSSIPRNQPIVDSLLDLQRFNERVDRVGDVIEQAHRAVEDAVGRATDAAEAGAKDLSAAVHEEAAALGPAYASYLRLKVGAVVDAFAATAAGLSGLPPETDQGTFVGDVVRRWAETGGPLRDPAPPPEEIVAFLRTFDLGYTVRRLKFVLKGLNAMYGRDGAHPDRRELDRAKARLWAMIGRVQAPVAELRAGASGGDGGDGKVAALREQVRALFPRASVDAALDEPASDWASVVAAYEDPRATALSAVRDALGAYLEERLAGFGAALREAFEEATAGWAPAATAELRVRFVGFPLWDTVLYPMQKVADLGELNRVEVVRMSPRDTELLPVEGKLQGVKLHHFGAFFDPKARANDYVWGRLDGAERLIWLLAHGKRADGSMPVDASTARGLCLRAFSAIGSEEAALRPDAPAPFRAVEALLTEPATPP